MEAARSQNAWFWYCILWVSCQRSPENKSPSITILLLAGSFSSVLSTMSLDSSRCTQQEKSLSWLRPETTPHKHLLRLAISLTPTSWPWWNCTELARWHRMPGYDYCKLWLRFCYHPNKYSRLMSWWLWWSCTTWSRSLSVCSFAKNVTTH